MPANVPLFLVRIVPAVLVLGLVLLLPFGSTMSSSASRAPDRQRPPLTPRWVFEPWVWEDEENTAAATVDLIDDYRERDIPVGVVIVDSPWQTNYNTFEMDPSFGNPHELMSRLRDRNIRVIFWATGFINTWSNDGPNRDISPNFEFARSHGFLVNDGRTYEWDKGEGAAVDFFNPDAVDWWYREMDKAWSYGIDGWKVDSPEGNLPDLVKTHAGMKTNREYGDQYYRTFYAYVAQKSPDAMITARPYDGGTLYAPVEANPAGWVGDQDPDWGPRGIEEALDNILASAEVGYSVLGSDIGGYRPGERFDRLFTRWTQLGALSPLMENGGRGEHRPWMIGPGVTPVYRYYAKLHHQLVPYFYGLSVEAHHGGEPIVRDGDRERRHYRLGNDLFVAPMVTRDTRRLVELPNGARWYDFWDDDTPLAGGSSFVRDVPIEQIPLYIRAGAILPMQVADGETGHGGKGSAGALTLLLYPEGTSRREVHPDEGKTLAVESTRSPRGQVTVKIGPSSEPLVLRIKEAEGPSSVAVETAGAESALTEAPSFEALEGLSAGWSFDDERDYVWVRLPATDTETVVQYGG